MVSFIFSLFCRFSPDLSRRILTRMPKYLSVLIQWQQEKDVRHHNLHWLGFAIKAMMFVPYQGQQKSKISTKISEHYVWSSHRREWRNLSHTLLRMMSTETDTFWWAPPGSMLSLLHSLLGNLSSLMPNFWYLQTQAIFSNIFSFAWCNGSKYLSGRRGCL